MNYIYSSRIEEDKMILNCTEKYFGNKNPPQQYDVMSINIKTSEVDLKKEVEVGILNSFVRINFKLFSVCQFSSCLGHTFTSTGIIAGAKSKKLMPFFLREECMTHKEQEKPDEEDGVIYTIRSDYYSQASQFDKSGGADKYGDVFVGMASDVPKLATLPLIDLSVITSKESFQRKVESYVTFS